MDKEGNSQAKLNPTPKTESEKLQGKIYLKVEQVSTHEHRDLIGDDWTFLALKSPTCYMIATHKRGLKVIENNVEVYCAELPIPLTSLVNIAYIDHLDSYIFNNRGKLFRKDINDKPPYLCLDMLPQWNPGAILLYSKVNKRLIVNENWNDIAILNLERKGSEILIKSKVGNTINEIKLFGRDERGLISLTNYGEIHLTIINYQMKKVFANNNFKIQLKQGRTEISRCFAICEKFKYALVEIISQYTDRTSRMVILTIKNSRFLSIRATFDFYLDFLDPKNLLEFYGYFGNHPLWVGLSEKDGDCCFFDYDTKEKELKELVEKRVSHQEYEPWKIQRCGNHLYYTGYGGRVMRLTLGR